MLKSKNIVISGTNFWNPGDDFVRDGVIRILHDLFPKHALNFLFYNFNQDFFPQSKFSGIHNMAAKGDLDQYRDFIDYIVIAGLSAGSEIKDLYQWIIDNNLQDRVFLIGAGYENNYVDKHIYEEPELTIFKNAKVITSRTKKAPKVIGELGLPFYHINCPAILSVPEVRSISPEKKLERIAFSIQLPHEVGISNHTCAKEMYLLAVHLITELANSYEVEIIAHHKSEYFHFLNLFKQYNISIPVLFSSYYHDLFELYKRYDAMVTTRLHASLFSNGFGIPGIILNDTDRHTHCLEGFPHSVWVNTKEKFYEEFKKLKKRNLFEITNEAKVFKANLLNQYLATLSKYFYTEKSVTTVKESIETKLTVADSHNSTKSKFAIQTSTFKKEEFIEESILPVHFFTIVLNGQPFIEYHIEIFRQLNFKWHWHIIEGVADLKNDTAWSIEGGGHITDELHLNGLSKDGTTEYLNEIQKQFPDNVTIYRKENGTFWNGKLEMVNSPLSNIHTDALLWEIDSDELWTVSQLAKGRLLYISNPEKTASYYLCRFFVGEKLVVTSINTYGNHTDFEWLRTWKYKPGDQWLSHEPPVLARRTGNGEWTDLAKINPFTHSVTKYHNLIFQHFAYVTPEQLIFKEKYYGYKGALNQWKILQAERKFPKSLKNYFAWVNDEAVVDLAKTINVAPLALNLKEKWVFDFDTAICVQTKDIVILRTDSIGDNIISLPVLHKLHEKYPHASITVICQSHLKEIYSNIKFVAKIISFEKTTYYQGKGLEPEFVKTLQSLKADLLLNLVYSSEPITYEIVKQVDATHKVGFEGDTSNISKEALRENILLYSQLVRIDQKQNNELEKYKTFLSNLNIDSDNLQPSITPDSQSREYKKNYFAENGLIPEETIVVFPFSQLEIKDFEKIGEIITHPSLEKYKFILLGGSEHTEKAEPLAASIPERIFNLVGKTSLLQAAAIIENALLLIGSDTGGGHLACSVGTPNVIIMGGGHFGRFMPYSKLTSLITLPLNCYGCNWRCSYDHAHCIKDVDLTMVLAAVVSALKTKSEKPRIYFNGTKDKLSYENLLHRLSNFIDMERVEVISEINYGAVPLSTKLILIAEEYIGKNNLIFAKNLLLNVLALEPTNFDALNDLAVIEIMNEQWDNAVQIFKTVIELDNENEIALENLTYLNAKLEANKNISEKKFLIDDSQKTHKKIKVSAIVSTYNSAKFIRGCLDDLINQTLYQKGELEIIVVNSGSQQNEEEIVNEFKNNYENIKYIKTERETLYAAWNRAVCVASGEYLTNANTDDRHRNDSFEIMSNFLDEKNTGVAYCDVWVTSIENETFVKNSASKTWRLPEFSLRQALAHCPFGSQVMWRRSLHKEIGYFEETYKIAGDYEFFLRASIAAGAVHLNQVLGLYYESEENLSYANPEKVIREVETFLNKYRKEINLAEVYPFLALHNNRLAFAAAKLDYASCISNSSVYPDYEFALKILYELLQEESSYKNQIVNNIAVVLYKQMNKKEAIEMLKLLPSDIPEVVYNRERFLNNLNNLKMSTIPFPDLLKMGDVIPLQNKYEILDENNNGVNREKLQNDIVYIAPFFNPSGYASEAISFALGLDKYVNLTIRHQNVFVSDEFIKNIPSRWKSILLRLHKVEPHQWSENFIYKRKSIIIHHQPGNSLINFKNVSYCIGRTMYETDRIPPDWVDKCNQMDEIWVPSKFNVETFANFGVEKEKIVVIPEPIDTVVFDPEKIEKYDLPNKASFNFLSIFEWTNRKGWDVLLKAYFETFTNNDDVCLYLRTYLLGNYDLDTSTILKQKIDKLITNGGYNKNCLPRIELLTTQLPFSEMLQLYKAVDAFVLPSRGEGWGRPYMEAMSMGLPVIGTNWSGNTEFMTNENSYLIDVEKLIEIKENEITSYLGHRWAQPSIRHLKKLLRVVWQNPEIAKAKGDKARKDIIEKFNLDAVAKIVVERLKQIEKKIIYQSDEDRLKKAENNINTPSLIWEGPQFVNNSLALVNRELCSRLTERCNLQLIKTEKDTFKPTPNGKYKSLAKCNKKLDRVEVHIMHQWPPNLTPPKEGHWVVIQPWEFGSLPKSWAEIFSTKVDEMWVPSNYVRQIYLDAGINPERVFVVPNGVDTKVFNSSVKPFKLKTKKKFKFLFVGGTIYRKGIDILVNAYISTFTSADDVCLVMKDFGGDSFYKGQTIKEKIQQIRSDKNTPEIEYLDKTLSEDNIAGLYGACNVLVHPYRGEGFGLPIAEAMACGLAVIVTNGGACLDFCSNENSMLLQAEKKYFSEKKISSHQTVDYPWLYEPLLEDLKLKLLFAYTHPEKIVALGKKAEEFIRNNFTWDHSIKIVFTRLKELSVKPMMRFSNTAPSEKGAQKQITDDFIQLLNEFRKSIEKNDLGTAVMLGDNLLTSYSSREHESVISYDALLNLAGNTNLAVGNTEKASEFFEKLLNLNPCSSAACVGLAEVFFSSERYLEAKTMYEWGVKNDPENQFAVRGLKKVNKILGLDDFDNSLDESSTLDEQIEKLFAETYSLYEQKSFKEALAVLAGLEKFVRSCTEEIHPDTLVSIINLTGYNYLGLDEIDNARQSFEKALNINQTSSSACAGLGEIYALHEMNAEAKTMFEWAVKNNPENQSALNSLAKVNRKLGFANNHNSLVLKNIDPLREIEKKLDLAEELISNNKNEEAEILLNEVLTLEPNNVVALNNISVIEIIDENYDDAIKSISKVLAINPEDDIALGNLDYLKDKMTPVLQR